ncbi:MAG: trehalose-phosphatase [Pseudomonadota bacterium]
MAVDLPQLNLGRHALFLDFDGTLVDIAPRPEMVQLLPETGAALERLQVCLGGALALVSGRPLDQLDDHLRPLALPAAGVHGLMRRDVHGHVIATPVNEDGLARVRAVLEDAAADVDGLLVEVKPAAVAFHYRGAPDRADWATSLARTAAEDVGLPVVAGKMVLEIKGAKASKADAISAFMAEPPFAGRVPVFAGDDVTDEDGFRAVNEHGGISIKVGAGETRANHRVADPRSFLAWLHAQ